MSSVISVSEIFHVVIRLLNTDTNITFGSVLIYVFFLKKTWILLIIYGINFRKVKV